MKLTWILYLVLAVAAIGGGVYYYVNKVDVTVEVSQPVPPAPSQKPPFPDTAGKLDTARHPKFPGQGNALSATPPGHNNK